MKKNKHVKYSKRTAKINPDMIRNEYKRLIKEIENEMSEFDSNEHKIKIKRIIGNKKIIGNLESMLMLNPNRLNDLEMSFSFNQIEAIYLNLKNQNKYYIDLRDKLYEIKEEYDLFCNNMIKNG